MFRIVRHMLKEKKKHLTFRKRIIRNVSTQLMYRTTEKSKNLFTMCYVRHSNFENCFQMRKTLDNCLVSLKFLIFWKEKQI